MGTVSQRNVPLICLPEETIRFSRRMVQPRDYLSPISANGAHAHWLDQAPNVSTHLLKVRNIRFRIEIDPKAELIQVPPWPQINVVTSR